MWIPIHRPVTGQALSRRHIERGCDHDEPSVDRVPCAGGVGRPAGCRLAPLRQRRRRHALFRSAPDRPNERCAAAARLELPHRRDAGGDGAQAEGSVRDDTDPRREQAVPHHSLQPRDRSRPANRHAALGVRRARGPQPELLGGHLARRRGLAGLPGEAEPAVSAASLHGHARRTADRARRRDGKAVRRFRHRGSGEPDDRTWRSPRNGRAATRSPPPPRSTATW